MGYNLLVHWGYNPFTNVLGYPSRPDFRNRGNFFRGILGPKNRRNLPKIRRNSWGKITILGTPVAPNMFRMFVYGKTPKFFREKPAAFLTDDIFFFSDGG